MLSQMVFGLMAAFVPFVAAADPIPKVQVFQTDASYPIGTKVTITYNTPDAFGQVAFFKLFQAGLPSDDPPNLPILTGDFGGGSISLQTICPNATLGYNTCVTPASGQPGSFTFITPVLLHSYTADEGGAPFNYFFGLTWTENGAPNYYYSKTFTLTAAVAVSSTAVATTAPTATAVASASVSATAAASADSSASTGLSTGAKAGIGAGIGAAALISIAGLAFFLIRRRKNKAEGGANKMSYAQAHESNSKEMNTAA